jgi:hypothetical protein
MDHPFLNYPSILYPSLLSYVFTLPSVIPPLLNRYYPFLYYPFLPLLSLFLISIILPSIIPLSIIPYLLFFPFHPSSVMY